MYDSEYSGHQELNPEQFFIDRSVTSQDTSQDTEADINLDLELVSRKDTNSSKGKLFFYRLFVLHIFSHELEKYFSNQLIRRNQAKVTVVKKK